MVRATKTTSKTEIPTDKRMFEAQINNHSSEVNEYGLADVCDIICIFCMYHIDTCKNRHQRYRFHGSDRPAYRGGYGIRLADGFPYWITKRHIGNILQHIPVPFPVGTYYRCFVAMLFQGSREGQRQQGRSHRQV